MRTISAAIQFTGAPKPLNRPGTITLSPSAAKALDEIEQTVAARCDMIAVLDVVRRPESFRGRIIALVKECVERFQDEGLVLFGSSLRHLDSFHTSEITSIASTRKG